jgi:hypothetical protein
MSVIENIDVVMGAQTRELDAAIANEIQNLRNLEEAAKPKPIQDIVDPKALDKQVAQFKDNAGKFKASTEVLAVGVNALGGTAFGQFAGLIGNATEKLGQFSELQKTGAAGATAFKAGLVGLVGVISFQLGNAIGNAVFETDKWNKELDKAIEKLKSLDGEMMKLKDLDFGFNQDKIDLIQDPKQREAEYKQMIARLLNEEKGAASQIADLKKQLKEIEFEQDGNIFAPLGLGLDDRLKTIPAQMELALANEKALFDKRMELERKIGEKSGSLEADKAKIELDKQIAEEQRKKGEEEKKRIEDLVKSKRDFIGGLKEELELLKAQNEARAVGKDFDPTTFKMRREFDKLSGGRDSLEFNRLDKQLTQQRDLERQMEKLKAESNQKSENKFGATVVEAGSVEAYKAMLERQNDQKGVEEEARKQTVLQEQMRELLQQANTKPTVQLTREIEAYERAQAEKKRLEEEAAREEQEKQKQADKERQELLREAESIQKRIDSMGNQPGKFGAASAQEGSVEAYKLLLQRDNEQKEIAAEAKQQTILQQRMADLLEQANMKPTVKLARAR